MKKTYLETLKENIDNNYFQKAITNDFNSEKINKKVKIGMNVGFGVLGFFCIIGIALLCLINVVNIEKGTIIFAISGVISILLGVIAIFIVPICNFKLIHKEFKNNYNFQKQNEYLKMALANLKDVNIENIFIDEQQHLTLEFETENKKYQIVYFNDYFELFDLSTNELIKKENTIHNLNQLIKIYYSDLDKTSFTSLNSFTLCMEIKLKKFAKLIISDFIGSIGE